MQPRLAELVFFSHRATNDKQVFSFFKDWLGLSAFIFIALVERDGRRSGEKADTVCRKGPELIQTQVPVVKTLRRTSLDTWYKLPGELPAQLDINIFLKYYKINCFALFQVLGV